MKKLNHLSLFSVERGFTLIELMIVVGIMSILAAIAIPAIQKYTFDAKEAEATAMLLSAWRDQQRVKMDCEAGKYQQCSGLFTDSLDSTTQGFPTLMYRPATSSPRFNLVTGGLDPSGTGGIRKLSLDELGYNVPHAINKFGMRVASYDIDGNPVFEKGKFMMGAEGYINNKTHILIIDENGTLRKACDAWRSYADPSAASAYESFTDEPLKCLF